MRNLMRRRRAAAGPKRPEITDRSRPPACLYAADRTLYMKLYMRWWRASEPVKDGMDEWHT
jgi:hypothetical protein